MVHSNGSVLVGREALATGVFLPAGGWQGLFFSSCCIFTTVLLLVGEPTIHAQPRSFDHLRPYLEQQLPEWLQRYKVPGASIALIREAQPKWIAYFGLADVGTQEPVTPQTAFQVASISNSLTAWGVMKLVNEGRIELDVPIDRYLSRWHLPDSRFEEREVTVRRLLSHTAGLPNPVYPPLYDPANRPAPELLLSGSGNSWSPVELTASPGSAFLYSNANYTVLQLIISESSGRPFTDYMYGAVLAPLGMQRSKYKLEEVPPEERAVPHDSRGRSMPVQFVAQLAAEGLNTTAGDLANFISAGMPSLRAAVRGYPVLPPQTIQEMTAPQVKIKGAESYGLGYFVETSSRGFKVISNGAGQPLPGWNSYFFAAPDTGDGLVILTNGDNGHLVINAVTKAWARAAGIGNLALTTAYRKIRATLWLITIAATVLALLLGQRFLAALRSGKREFSRKNTTGRLIGIALLATGILLTWTTFQNFILYWMPGTAIAPIGTLTAMLAVALLMLLFPERQPEERRVEVEESEVD